MRGARAAVARVALGLAAAGAALGADAFGAREAAAQPHRGDNEINLAVGETKTLPARGVSNFGEGDKAIIESTLTTQGDKIVITAKKPGNTTFLVLKQDGSQQTFQVSVAKRPVEAVQRELQQLLDKMPGVSTRPIGTRVFIEGAVTTDVEYRRIQQIAGLYEGQVEALVNVGRGPADGKILIRLDFFFVQYEKSASYAVGLAWPGSIGGDAAAGTFTNPAGGAQIGQSTFTYDFIAKTPTAAQASIVNQPLPRLDIAARHGWAKVLKQSTVLTSNGAEATFDSGGEQNFVAATGLTASLVKIQFGTNVTVLPRYEQNSKDVEVKLSADVSDLTPAAAASTLPGRSTSKLSTLVTLKLGQALVLSGIRTQNQRHDVVGLPGLSQIPVFGVLFSSNRDDLTDVEGAVFIIPSVVETVPKSSVEIIKNALGTFGDYSGEIDQVNTFNKTPPSAK